MIGAVILVGGGLQPENEAVFLRILEHAGPRVGVFGTASGDPVGSAQPLCRSFEGYGAAPEVVPITSENADESAFDTEVLSQLRRCTGFFFGGGDQRKIARALPGTPALEVFRRKFAEGATVAGTAMMADPMIKESHAAQFSAPGVKPRFHKAPSTANYYGGDATGHPHSHVRLRAEVARIKVSVEVSEGSGSFANPRLSRQAEISA